MSETEIVYEDEDVLQFVEYDLTAEDPQHLDTGRMMHDMQANGMLHNGYPEDTCCCGHMTCQHLDCVSLCLEKECLCERFLENGYRTTIPRRQKGNEKEKADVQVQENQQLNSYIQALSKM